MKIEIKSKIRYFLYRDDKEFSLNAIKEFEKWKFEGKKQWKISPDNNKLSGILIEREFSDIKEIITENNEISIQDLINDIDEEVRKRTNNAFQKIIRPFLDSLIIKLGMPIEVEEQVIRWSNENEIKEELKKAGYKLKKLKIMSEIILRSNILGTSDVTSVFDYLQNHISKIDTNDWKEISRIIRWMEKGMRDEDEYDKFLCYWIAFNGLYELVCQKIKPNANNDASKFEKLINEIFSKDHKSTQSYIQNLRHNFKSLIKSLSGLELHSQSGKKNLSEELKSLEEKNDETPYFLEILVRCIYAIRKNLFHGYLSLSQRDGGVECCVPLLKEITLKCIDKVIEGNIL